MQSSAGHVQAPRSAQPCLPSPSEPVHHPPFHANLDLDLTAQKLGSEKSGYLRNGLRWKAQVVMAVKRLPRAVFEQHGATKSHKTPMKGSSKVEKNLKTPFDPRFPNEGSLTLSKSVCPRHCLRCFGGFWLSAGSVVLGLPRPPEPQVGPLRPLTLASCRLQLLWARSKKPFLPFTLV